MSVVNNAINAPLPLVPAQGGLGTTTQTQHALLLGQGTSNVSSLLLTAGQFPLGQASADPLGATFVNGANINITVGSNTVTIASTGHASFAWNDVTTSTQALAVDQGYSTNNGASLVTYTLPTTAAFGTEIEIAGFSSGGWTIHQNVSQLIHFGSSTTTTGTGGSISSTNAFDQIKLLCVVANTTWVVRGSMGNLTVV